MKQRAASAARLFLRPHTRTVPHRLNGAGLKQKGSWRVHRIWHIEILVVVENRVRQRNREYGIIREMASRSKQRKVLGLDVIPFVDGTDNIACDGFDQGCSFSATLFPRIPRLTKFPRLQSSRGTPPDYTALLIHTRTRIRWRTSSDAGWHALV